MSTDDRRSPGATRVPFEALVEVGGSLGPSFEAQAIDISEEGMHLRTAYLPEVGQPMTCRFEASGQSILATGEVVWKQEAGKGGEFGVRFVDLDPQAAEAVARMLLPNAAPPNPPPRPSQSAMQVQRGSKVRLHIEGLASPMRAHVKESRGAKVTAFSGLGFLQVGKELELEDAATGAKRPARIARVECEIDPESRVPHLVMSFHYADEPVEESVPIKEATPEPTVTASPEAPAASTKADEDIERASDEMKGFVARTATKVTPALERLVMRAKTTVALLAAKRKGGSGDDVGIPIRRRTTSPPPQGGLHAAGRKVVRDSLPSAKEVIEAPPKIALTKKRVAIATGVVGLAVIGALVLRKPAPAPTATNDASATTTTATQPLVPTTAEAPLTPPPSVLQPVTTMPATPITAGATPANPAVHEAAQEMASSNDVLEDDPSGAAPHGRHRSVHVTPFSNGPVAHGNVLHLKMDGAIEKIEGDSSPAGFTVVIPGRRSLEPAAPLAARDGRIGSIRVTNDGTGAELAVAFKDGVPNYLVRAKGDVLEIVLAPNRTLGNDTRAEVHPVSTAPRRHHRHH